MFCRKCEDTLQLSGEAYQVIDNPTAEQKNNVGIVNCLNYLQRFLVPLCERYGSQADPLKSSLSAVQSIQQSAVQPLVQSIIDAVTAIVVTMHQEKFEASLETFKTVPQCSLYMRELQEFLSRVQKQFLSPFEQTEYMKNVAIEIAQEMCRFFILHATLLRPLSNHRRLCLAADCAQVELVMNILCDRLSDVGEPYLMLRSFRPLLVQSAEEIVSTCVQPGFCIPLSLIIQLLISMSPEELPSPHQSVGWSLTRYAEWFENHPSEADRLSFLRGTVESYAQHIIEQEKPQYAITYPLIMKLFEFSCSV
ncbi:unnamed protein product [Soboliphyme baturini]|uniref:Conserved oligomeric Golgi complex subunit 5 n=1 Tax=Soboliphyme baturini TaxID=241478 RepID=A0A183IN57_9BILA|nr:unnamed protein product [Soboliphyme baturini]